MPLVPSATGLVPITGGYTSGAFFPAIAPVQPYILPSLPFDVTITTLGVRLGWGKAHTCACTYYPSTHSVAGSPNAQCTTCSGRGIYWDPLVPFVGIISYGHRAGVRDEPGMRVTEAAGLVYQAEPTLTIPYSSGNVWESCSEYDIIVEVDSQMRFNARLIVGKQQTVPYQHGVAIATSGAVTTWAPTGSGSGMGTTIPIGDYSVNGASVILGSEWTAGTPYIVEFNANPTYVCFRIGGGFPHTRNFNRGQTAYPKRFHLTAMELFIRGLPAGAA